MSKYNLTDYERDVLEGVLSMAQRIVDLQYDEATEQEMQAILVECADLFGIETHEMIVTEQEDGTIRVEAKREEPKNSLGWTPRVISNKDQDNDNDSDL